MTLLLDNLRFICCQLCSSSRKNRSAMHVGYRSNRVMALLHIILRYVCKTIVKTSVTWCLLSARNAIIFMDSYVPFRLRIGFEMISECVNIIRTLSGHYQIAQILNYIYCKHGGVKNRAAIEIGAICDDAL